MRYVSKIYCFISLLSVYIAFSVIALVWLYTDGNHTSTMLVTASDIKDGGEFFIPKEKKKNDIFSRLGYRLSRELHECQRNPPRLVGRMNISLEQLINEADDENSTHVRQLNYGGTYEPQECLPREATAIIIPYRDRPEHLRLLLSHLHRLLQRQQLKYGIYVVEMELPTQFNRGLLANVGFMSAGSISNYTCYIIHDVDLLPRDDRNFYTCGSNPRHLVTSSSKYKDQLPYEKYVGGVLALTPHQYKTINGFSNLYFGWGGEDDDMLMRIEEANFTIDRPQNSTGDYFALPHRGDNSNPPNPQRYQLLASGKYRRLMEGLSSLQYNRRALEFRATYTWILVHVRESDVMKKYKKVQAEPYDRDKKHGKIRVYRKHSKPG